MIKKLVLVFLFVLIEQTRSQRGKPFFASVGDQTYFELNEGDYRKIVCSAEGKGYKAEIYRNETKVGQNKGITHNLIIKNASISDSGYYECYAFTLDGGMDLVVFNITVKPKIQTTSKTPSSAMSQTVDSTPTSISPDTTGTTKTIQTVSSIRTSNKFETTSTPPVKKCDKLQTCKNGQCIKANLQCNGVYDCKDGSDESDCSVPYSNKSSTCNPVGTRFKINNKCYCRNGYEGNFCESCHQNSFIAQNGRCLSCFCNGLLSATCEASNFTYIQERTSFRQENHGWTVVNRYLNYTSKHVRTSVKSGLFIFSGVPHEQYKDKWFFLVKSFKMKNRIRSYGGNISFSIYYDGKHPKHTSEIMPLEMRLAGANIALEYVHPFRFNPGGDVKISIPLREFQTGAGVSRYHFLMVLSKIDTIMLSAKFIPEQNEAKIRDFRFDYAVEKDGWTKNRRAVNVEICSCGEGYAGSSCETCARGYEKKGGVYLAECQRKL